MLPEVDEPWVAVTSVAQYFCNCGITLLSMDCGETCARGRSVGGEYGSAIQEGLEHFEPSGLVGGD